MKTLRQNWKGIALLLVMAGMYCTWPLVAGPSTKGNLADNANENISLAIYADDDDWTTDVSAHVLVGGVFGGSNAITSGDVGPLKVAADGALQVDIESGTVTDTNSAAIKTATEGAEDELDGTTTDGPLAKIAHTDDTLQFARIDVNLTGGSYGTLVAAQASNKIYVVEMLLTVSAQSELEFVEDPAGTPAILAAAPPLLVPAYGGAFINGPQYRFVTDTVNKALGIDEVANGTVNIRGYIWFYYAP